MTPKEVAWLYQELNKLAAGEPCVDNYRAARMWVSSQMRRFRKQEADGCCGSVNIVVKNPNPIKKGKDMYLIGINYGH